MVSHIEFLLQGDNNVPSNYIQFLDYASENVLLYKTGGSYILSTVFEEYSAAQQPDSLVHRGGPGKIIR